MHEMHELPLWHPHELDDKQGRDRAAVRICEDTAELHRKKVEAIRSNFFCDRRHVIVCVHWSLKERGQRI